MLAAPARAEEAARHGPQPHAVAAVSSQPPEFAPTTPRFSGARARIVTFRMNRLAIATSFASSARTPKPGRSRGRLKRFVTLRALPVLAHLALVQLGPLA